MARAARWRGHFSVVLGVVGLPLGVATGLAGLPAASDFGLWSVIAGAFVACVAGSLWLAKATSRARRQAGETRGASPPVAFVFSLLGIVAAVSLIGVMPTLSLVQRLSNPPNVEYRLQGAEPASSDALERSRDVIDRRLASMGIVHDAVLSGNDAILVRVHIRDGRLDDPLVRKLIAPGLLTLHLVHPDPGTLSPQQPAPAGYRWVEMLGSLEPTLVEDRPALIDGVADARSTEDQSRRPAVSVRFGPEAAASLATLTERNIGRGLALLVDGKCISAPTIQSRVSSEALITGTFSSADARLLAASLRAGMLPVQLAIVDARPLT